MLQWRAFATCLSKVYPLFRLGLYIVLLFSALICPAMGGVCCGQTQLFDLLGANDTIQDATHTCGCCCQHSASSAPESPEESRDHCQTCFCGGALPAGPSSAEIVTDAMSAAESTHVEFANQSADKSSVSLANRVDIPPIHGRLMLILYGELLL